MQFTEDAKHLLGSKANHARASGMPPSRRIAQNLGFGRRANGRKGSFGIGLDVKHIDGAPRAKRITRPRMPNQNTRRLQMLLTGFAALEGSTHLEQGQIHHAARLIAGSSLQQAWQQGGAHMAHLGRDGVFQHRRIRAAAE